jgi:hypothetical protein
MKLKGHGLGISHGFESHVPNYQCHVLGKATLTLEVFSFLSYKIELIVSTS